MVTSLVFSLHQVQPSYCTVDPTDQPSVTASSPLLPLSYACSRFPGESNVWLQCDSNKYCFIENKWLSASLKFKASHGDSTRAINTLIYSSFKYSAIWKVLHTLKMFPIMSSGEYPSDQSCSITCRKKH